MSGPLSPEELKEVESAIAMARSKQTPPPPAAPETDDKEPWKSHSNKPSSKESASKPPPSKESAGTTEQTGKKRAKIPLKRKPPPKYAEGSTTPSKEDNSDSKSPPASGPPKKRRKLPSTKKKKPVKRKPAVREKDDKAWNARFEELKEWKQQHGHTKIPRTCKENPSLGRWCQHQRELYRNRLSDKKDAPLLSAEKMTRLVSIGFEFVIRNDAWESQYSALVQYKKEHGDFNVPHKTKLGRWVSDQRRTYRNRLNGVKKGTHITPERIERLESIGFSWDTANNKSDQWDSRFRELQAFKQVHGHCNVPKPKEGATSLGIWVNHQRVEGRKLRKGEPSCLTAERADRLNSIGFQWELKKSPNASTASLEQEPMQELKIAAQEEQAAGGMPKQHAMV